MKRALRDLAVQSLMPAFALGLLSLCSCSDGPLSGDGDATFGATAADPSQRSVARLQSPAVQGMIAAMSTAPFETEFRATRRMFRADGDVPVEWSEEVVSNGQGEYSIEPLDVHSAHPDAEAFLQARKRYEFLDFQHRDFRPYDESLFHANYSHTVLPGTHVHAGVACLALEIQRPVALGGGRHLVHVDPNTHLVLRWEQLDDQGVALAWMQVETLDLSDPDHTGFDLAAGYWTNQALDLYSGVGLSELAGFRVLSPTLLPAGFQLLQADLVQGGPIADTWVRLLFTDGVERAWIMHRKQSQAAQDGAHQASQVHTFQDLSWSIVAGEVEGFEVLAMGSVPRALLLDLLSSAF